MTALHNFIEANMIVVNFIYGLVFFTVGLAVALQQRSLSRFRLARHLWLLAAFGIVHGIAEWGYVFIPIHNLQTPSDLTGDMRTVEALAFPMQSTGAPPDEISILYRLQELAWAGSFAFLLQFATNILCSHIPWPPAARKSIMGFAPVWSITVAAVGVLMLPGEDGEIWIRYLLGLPAAALSATAFILERQSFAQLPSPTVKTNLTLTAIPFALYGLLGGIIVPREGVGPIDWLNYQSVFAVTGLPIQFYRATVGLLMAFFVIRTLSLFDLELRHRLELNEKRQALLQDRQRIARDLHDGVIQSIYAAGLQLEVTANSINRLPVAADAASPGLHKVLDQLNSVISNIRGYIFQLEPDNAEKLTLERRLQLLIDELLVNSPIEASLITDGDAVTLDTEQEQNLLMIAQECLSNVAKHSWATCCQVRLSGDAEGVRFSVRDNGIGLEAEKSAAGWDRGRGLDNIGKRARSLGAELTVDGNNSRGGTEVSLWLPHQISQQFKEKVKP